jgi:carbamoyltransferase
LITLGIHIGPHDSSVALLNDADVIFHLQGERLSNIKYDYNAVQVLNYVKNYTKHIDNVVFTGVHELFQMHNSPVSSPEIYLTYLRSISKEFSTSNFNVYKFYHNHHEIHAATSFYNSGFDKALCLVIDGLGSEFLVNYSDENMFINNIGGRETKSSFIMEYPNKIKLVEKQITINEDIPTGKTWIDNKTYITRSFSEAMAYDIASSAVGLTNRDAGKTMGMSPYGSYTEHPEYFCKDGITNEKIFATDNMNVPYYAGEDIGQVFLHKANFAYKLQKEAEENVLQEVLRLLEKTKEKNLCLSGGFFLNCVSNYNLLKKIPKDINLYIEPMCSDIGNSIGAAKYLYYSLTKSKEKNPQQNIYFGPKYNYSINDLKNEITKSVSYQDVAELIAEKNIVAMYQGSSESGPRALGNRSILYDPRDENGKDHVNIVKKREWFRPFAGSVLKEHAKDWFDLITQDESKFMMFAVDVLKEKQNLIPAITHVDGTCRIQTVKFEDNKNFYNLINEFYKITGVPILFNTSFNLAGNVIVETLEDALWTLHNSDINYLYLPELGVLVTK